MTVTIVPSGRATFSSVMPLIGSTGVPGRPTGRDAFGIQSLDECDDIGVALHSSAGSQVVSVAMCGEGAELPVEQVRDHVADAPGAGDGGTVPVRRGQLAQ